MIIQPCPGCAATNQVQLERIAALEALCRDLEVRLKDAIEELGWIPVTDSLPESGKPVLVACGKKALRAAYSAKFEMNEEEWGFFNDGEGSDYDEATDATYWPEGWYEWNDSEEIHWMIHDPVTHWMPLPKTPNANITGR